MIGRQTFYFYYDLIQLPWRGGILLSFILLQDIMNMSSAIDNIFGLRLRSFYRTANTMLL